MQKINGKQKYISAKTLVLAALFAAMSIILGKVLKIAIGDTIRISFENLPIVIASLSLGPVWGAAVGACADIVGCLVVGYSINPLITVCAVLIGILPYVFSGIIRLKNTMFRYMSAVLLTHIICSIVLKTAALWLWYKTPFATLIWRLPIYIGTGLLEGYICALLMRRGVFDKVMKKK